MATLHIENINEDCVKQYEQISLAEKQRINELIEMILKAQCKSIKQGFAERWHGQFKLCDEIGDEKLDYLMQRYQL